MESLFRGWLAEEESVAPSRISVALVRSDYQVLYCNDQLYVRQAGSDISGSPFVVRDLSCITFSTPTVLCGFHDGELFTLDLKESSDKFGMVEKQGRCANRVSKIRPFPKSKEHVIFLEGGDLYYAEANDFGSKTQMLRDVWDFATDDSHIVVLGLKESAIYECQDGRPELGEKMELKLSGNRCAMTSTYIVTVSENDAVVYFRDGSESERISDVNQVWESEGVVISSHSDMVIIGEDIVRLRISADIAAVHNNGLYVWWSVDDFKVLPLSCDTSGQARTLFKLWDTKLTDQEVQNWPSMADSSVELRQSSQHWVNEFHEYLWDCVIGYDRGVTLTAFYRQICRQVADLQAVSCEVETPAPKGQTFYVKKGVCKDCNGLIADVEACKLGVKCSPAKMDSPAFISVQGNPSSLWKLRHLLPASQFRVYHSFAEIPYVRVRSTNLKRITELFHSEVLCRLDVPPKCACCILSESADAARLIRQKFEELPDGVVCLITPREDDEDQAPKDVRTLYCENIPNGTTLKELYEAFGRINGFVLCEFASPADGGPRSAKVRFNTASWARTAQGEIIHIRGQKLKLSGPQSAPPQNRYPGGGGPQQPGRQAHPNDNPPFRQQNQGRWSGGGGPQQSGQRTQQPGRQAHPNGNPPSRPQTQGRCPGGGGPQQGQGRQQQQQPGRQTNPTGNPPFNPQNQGLWPGGGGPQQQGQRRQQQQPGRQTNPTDDPPPRPPNRGNKHKKNRGAKMARAPPG